MLKINEIFHSIQGESSKSGTPCVFIRLTYCNLRCSYCDSEYSFYEGKDMSISEILKEVEKYNCNLVEVTGGEPLLQKESIDLMKTLLEKNFASCLGAIKIIKDGWETEAIPETPGKNAEKTGFFAKIFGVNK